MRAELWNMRLSISDVNTRQQAFAAAIARGAGHAEAATKAGYVGAAMAAWRLLRDPKIIAAIEQELRGLAATELLPGAHAALVAALGVGAPLATRLKAADIVLKHYGPDKGSEAGALEMLTADELETLEAALREQRDAIIAKAKPVEAIELAPVAGLFD